MLLVYWCSTEKHEVRVGVYVGVFTCGCVRYNKQADFQIIF